eukprot:Polyplicarium_translucidae@DN3077_c0_g1_i21.p1
MSNAEASKTATSATPEGDIQAAIIRGDSCHILSEDRNSVEYAENLRFALLKDGKTVAEKPVETSGLIVMEHEGTHASFHVDPEFTEPQNGVAGKRRMFEGPPSVDQAKQYAEQKVGSLAAEKLQPFKDGGGAILPMKPRRAGDNTEKRTTPKAADHYDYTPEEYRKMERKYVDEVAKLKKDCDRHQEENLNRSRCIAKLSQENATLNGDMEEILRLSRKEGFNRDGSASEKKANRNPQVDMEALRFGRKEAARRDVSISDKATTLSRRIEELKVKEREGEELVTVVKKQEEEIRSLKLTAEGKMTETARELASVKHELLQAKHSHAEEMKQVERRCRQELNVSKYVEASGTERKEVLKTTAKLEDCQLQLKNEKDSAAERAEELKKAQATVHETTTKLEDCQLQLKNEKDSAAERAEELKKAQATVHETTAKLEDCQLQLKNEKHSTAERAEELKKAQATVHETTVKLEDCQLQLKNEKDSAEELKAEVAEFVEQKKANKVEIDALMESHRRESATHEEQMMVKVREALKLQERIESLTKVMEDEKNACQAEGKEKELLQLRKTMAELREARDTDLKRRKKEISDLQA